jgi:hypothetical protein
MAGNQAVVEFLLKWSEQGGQLPDKVKRDLDRMGQGVGQATTITDRLGLAFTKLERNEPTQALRRVRGVVEELGLGAVGASGKLGQMGFALASLGGPAALTTVAGVGLIAGAFRLMTLEATRTAEATKKAEEALVDLVDSPRLRVLEQIIGPSEEPEKGFQGQLEAAQARLAELQAPKPGGGAGGRPETLGTPEQIIAQQRTIARLTDDLSHARIKLAKITAGMTEDATAAATRRAKEEERIFNEGTRALIEAANRRREAIYGTAPRELGVTTQRTMAQILSSVYGPGRLRRTVPLEYAVPAEGTFDTGGRLPTAPGQGLDAAALMSSLFALIGSSRGGTGGALAGLGGVATAALPASPLVGVVLSGLGGMFSLFDHSEDRRTDRIVQAIDRMAKEVGLERVTVVFTGPDGHEIRRALSELESSDAVQRVPAPAGAAG